MRRQWQLGIALMVALGAFGCTDGAGARLEQLRDAPLADYDLTSEYPVERSERAGSDSAGVPSPSRITFRIDVSEGDPDEAFETLVAELAAAGYRDGATEGPVSFSARQQTSDGLEVVAELTKSTSQPRITLDLSAR